MKRTKDGQFIPKYEKEDIDGRILKILKKHPDGLTHKEIIAKMPKDFNESVINGFLLLMVHNSELVPVTTFRINKKKKSPYTGLLNERINHLHDIMFDELKEKLISTLTNKTSETP